MLNIGHEVVRPGRHWGDADVTIPVPEELETTPGIPMTGREIDWYAREYPLETMNITERASRDWSNTLRDLHAEMREIRKEHDKLNSNLIMAARSTMEMDATAEASGDDISQLVKDKARQLGYLEVGITSYDPRYDYKSKRGFTVLPHAICLAYEQDFEPTQTIPSVDAEIVHSSTYRTQAAAGLELGNFIRSLGYKAHVIHSSDATGPVIPMFVAAGLGQLGACGYLLSPHTGNRMRLMMITTDANVTYDAPVDYGIHAFCQVCQVCVNRCPGRALMRDKIWWRGIEKNKLYFKRCRPVMARYLGCGVCMKVCPIQKYGLKNTMGALCRHRVRSSARAPTTSKVTTWKARATSAPAKLPVFERGFFDMPHGNSDEWAFESMKDAARDNDGEIPDDMLEDLKLQIQRAIQLQSGDVLQMMAEDQDYI